ncbi:hypothetical protein AB0368_06585 [Actinoplanes sp. NPDC051475]|uniref:hypothetical protein n=1 Tax=Actinoplanes sp. NPDC051475 TaxID=3157225 RepID=UPI00344DC1A7
MDKVACLELWTVLIVRTKISALAVGVMATVALPLLGACADGSDEQAFTPVASSPSVSASGSSGAAETPQARAGSEAVAAYRQFMAAWVDAAKVADPDAKALRTYGQGDALKTVVSAMFANRMEKKVVLGEPVLDPKPVKVEPTRAPTRVTLLDCMDDTKWLEYKASGELWDDVPGGRRKVYIMVVKSGDGWKVDILGADVMGSC